MTPILAKCRSAGVETETSLLDRQHSEAFFMLLEDRLLHESFAQPGVKAYSELAAHLCLFSHLAGCVLTREIVFPPLPHIHSRGYSPERVLASCLMTGAQRKSDLSKLSLLVFVVTKNIAV